MCHLKTLLKKDTYKGAFTIDLSEINKCKGIVYIEVLPQKATDKLILDNVESLLYSGDKPYKLESNHPIINGELHFKPSKGSNDEMKSIVRILLVA
ncbi:hypothetical protein G1K97_13250 [Tenacibaculum finnmarkense]|uniref:hypothetical protein n=1 Tax=Tenacibaculum finnmarkense TaxID=2781243 RepID=UPI001EFAFFA1|nr:hypothetical protein [Tenacibaculum finnmarkense]MCG8894705.1 hypothetical protein [Tenacibaculum finnmarkense]MCG8902798.1 hypothetical protein [Tenacibaculum finnmarkense]